MDESNKSWKTSIYVIGGGMGMLAGLFAAYLYARTADDAHPGTRPGRISTGDAFRVGMTALGLIRQVSDLASKK